MLDYKDKFQELSCCVLMATYNNAATIGKVVSDILSFNAPLIIVNDGSTDNTLEVLEEFGDNISIHSYEINVGKGWALRQGFEVARKLGFKNAITIDSDGQHFATDIPLFIEELEKQTEPCLILGNRNMSQDGIPSKSSFGNRFSNFWYWVETGDKQPDTQTGYRLYPIEEYKDLHFYTKKFEFEIEVLIRSSWRGIKVSSVDVGVKYFQGDERVSHFRPFKDFFRISVLNSVLTTIALLYIKPRDFIMYFFKNDLKKIFIEQITAHNESDEKLSFTLGFGVFMGIVPIWGFQMLVAFFLAKLMKLNKTLVIIAANISLPPLVPFILLSSYWLGGVVLGNSDMQAMLDNFKYIQSGEYLTFINKMGYSFYQYIIGAFLLAFSSGLTTFAISYLVIKLTKGKNLEV
jgi:glycosyltransferase involved in cell wall biosynthesis